MPSRRWCCKKRWGEDSRSSKSSMASFRSHSEDLIGVRISPGTSPWGATSLLPSAPNVYARKTPRGLTNVLPGHPSLAVPRSRRRGSVGMISPKAVSRERGPGSTSAERRQTVKLDRRSIPWLRINAFYGNGILHSRSWRRTLRTVRVLGRPRGTVIGGLAITTTTMLASLLEIEILVKRSWQAKSGITLCRCLLWTRRSRFAIAGVCADLHTATQAFDVSDRYVGTFRRAARDET